MSFTSGNDTNILQATDSSIVGAGLGDDIYIISEATISENQEITISDTNGANTLQLIDGLAIASSQVANDAVMLTLSNGAVITVLGASDFNFDVGGNALLGITGTVQDFDTFAADTLGTTVPDEGTVSGGSVTIGEDETAADNIFTLTELPTQTETTLTWNGVDVDEAIAFLQTLTGLDLEDLGIEAPGDITITIGDNIEVVAGDDFFQFAVNTPTALYAAIMSELMSNEVSTTEGIVLTPTENNGGTFESGFTTDDNDLIFVGRTELLHGAYIDGGEGYNTIEIDMKGFFAQPYQLLNIQEIQIQNLTNYYSLDEELVDYLNLEDMGDLAMGDVALTGDESILDLSRASDLEVITITESGAAGGLFVLGIKNAATASLSGDFEQDVTLYYNTVTQDHLDIDLYNVTFDDAANFTIAHNVGTLNVYSGGNTNVLDGNVDFGDYFQELYVRGEGQLVIEDDLEFAFGEAFIDASENAGGLRVSVSSLDDEPLEVVEIMGSQARDVITLNNIADGALLTINTNTGRDTLIIEDNLRDELSAGAGSVITGENLTVQVDSNADLRLADVSGVDSFVISPDARLQLTLAQVNEVGIENFSADHGTVPVLTIELTEDATLSEIIDLTALDSDIRLAFEIQSGVTLTLTAEELHTYLTENAVTGDGNVVITEAGLTFNIDDPAIDTGEDDVNGAILGDGFGTIEDDSFDGEIHVERSQDGYERPLPDENTDTLIIDTTGDAAVEIDGLDADQVETLIIKGDQDAVFTDTVKLADNFTIDFSELTGNLIDLTIENFESITEADEVDDWGQIIGNDAEDVRINVMLSGDVAEEGQDSGLISSGVAQYVVVDITDINGNGEADDAVSFHLCDNTQDLEVIGLQGNAGNILTFTNIPWGAVNPTILLEGDGKGDWTELDKADGNPNASNVGTVVAGYFFDGAPANVLITNQGVNPGETSTGEERAIVVDGIEVDNAASLNITVEDGNAVITDITDGGSGDGLKDIDLTSANDVTLYLDGDESGVLDSIDASGVTGDAVLIIAENEFVDLSETALTDIDAMVLEDGSILTLTIDQISDIDVMNITVANEDDLATLNIGGYAGQEFDFSALALDGINVDIVTFAEGEDITVDAATDFTGIFLLVIPDGTNVEISAAQYQQLVQSEAIIITDDDGDPTEPEGSLTVILDGDLTLTETYAEPDNEDASDLFTLNGSNVTFQMSDGEVLNVETHDLADGLQVSGDADAAIKPLVNFTFDSDADGGNFEDTIDVADYQDVDLSILDTLLDNFQIGGDNSQSIEDLLDNLANANILNIYQEEAPADLDPRDREVVVESLASPDGIEFSAEGSLADYVRAIDLTLEADADHAASVEGDLLVNDVQVEAGYTTLTINTVDTDGNAVGPVTIDGDIYSEGDDGAGDDGELLSVTINAGMDLLIGDGLGSEGTGGGNLIFSSTDADADEATLTLTGEGDVTIKSVEAGENIDTLNIVTTGYTGDLTITAGSDALEMGDATSLVFTGDGDIVLDTDDEAGNNGIDGDDLTSIDASGYTGTLTLGVIESVSETDFTFTAGTGTITATLSGTLDADPEANPAEPGWTLNTGANTTLTLVDTTFTSGALNITGTGSVVIDGDGGVVDLRVLLDADGNSLLNISAATTIELAPDTALILTPEQLDALNEAGVTFTYQAVDPDADPAEVEAQIAVVIPADADLTAANEDLDADLDLSQADNLILLGDATLTGDQVSGKTVTEEGAGGYDLTLTDVTDTTDLSNITVTGELTAEADASATGISLAATVISDLILTVTGDALTDLTVTGVEDEVVADGDDAGDVNADFGGLTADGLDVEFQLDSTDDVNLNGTTFAATVNAGSTTLSIDGTGTVTTEATDGSELDAGTITLGGDATLSIEAAEHAVVGGNVNGTGTLEVNDLGADAVTIDTSDAGDTVDYMLTFTAKTALVTIDNFTADSANAQDILNFSAVLDLEAAEHTMTKYTAAIDNPNQISSDSILVVSSAVGNAVDAAAIETAFAEGGAFVAATGDDDTAIFGNEAEKIIIVSDGANADVWYWEDTLNGQIEAAELTLIGTLTNTDTADIGTGNFDIA